jgi:hypothetical protein
MSQGADRSVLHDAAMIQQLLKFRGSGGPIMCNQRSLTPDVGGQIVSFIGVRRL